VSFATCASLVGHSTSSPVALAPDSGLKTSDLQRCPLLALLHSQPGRTFSLENFSLEKMHQEQQTQSRTHSSTEFYVIYGFMPAKATIFNLKCDPPVSPQFAEYADGEHILSAMHASRLYVSNWHKLRHYASLVLATFFGCNISHKTITYQVVAMVEGLSALRNKPITSSKLPEKKSQTGNDKPLSKAAFKNQRKCEMTKLQSRKYDGRSPEAHPQAYHVQMRNWGKASHSPNPHSHARPILIPLFAPHPGAKYAPLPICPDFPFQLSWAEADCWAGADFQLIHTGRRGRVQLRAPLLKCFHPCPSGQSRKGRQAPTGPSGLQQDSGRAEDPLDLGKHWSCSPQWRLNFNLPRRTAPECSWEPWQTGKSTRKEKVLLSMSAASSAPERQPLPFILRPTRVILGLGFGAPMELSESDLESSLQMLGVQPLEPSEGHHGFLLRQLYNDSCSEARDLELMHPASWRRGAALAQTFRGTWSTSLSERDSLAGTVTHWHKSMTRQVGNQSDPHPDESVISHFGEPSSMVEQRNMLPEPREVFPHSWLVPGKTQSRKLKIHEETPGGSQRGSGETKAWPMMEKFPEKDTDMNGAEFCIQDPTGLTPSSYVSKPSQTLFTLLCEDGPQGAACWLTTPHKGPQTQATACSSLCGAGILVVVEVHRDVEKG
ncbi:Eukaryotic translation initiation factor 2A, partial [Galemys pyrenaicus]